MLSIAHQTGSCALSLVGSKRASQRVEETEAEKHFQRTFKYDTNGQYSEITSQQ